MPAGPELIRAINKQRVLRLIRSAGPLSRADAAEQTGLTRPTISAVVTELLDEGWVEEMGMGESSGGRPPILLRFDPQSRWVVGAELGAGHVRAILADLSGEVVRAVKYRVESSSALKELERVEGAIRELLVDLPTTGRKGRVAGVGIGITGVVDPAAGVWRYSPHFDGRNLPVAQILAGRLNLPVWIENDARAMAWGERSLGAARGVDNLVYIRAGVGIGAGIIIGGKLYSGYDAGAGEIGHTLALPHGPQCRCGRNGCLEAVAGASAIARRAVERIQEGRLSLIADLVNGNLNNVIGTTVIEAAKQGDRVALDTLAEAGVYLGTAIGNLINLLNPSMVVIGGGSSRAGDALMQPLKQAAQERILDSQGRVSIVPTSAGENAGPVGGAAMVIEELFRVPSVS